MRRILIALLLCVTLNMDAFAHTSLQALVDKNAKPFLSTHGIPGAAIAIYYQGHEYLFMYGYADKDKKVPVTKDTIFDLASISKVYTTTMLATQVLANKIKLNDPIVKYLPTLTGTSKLPIDQVTVLELATHTAGFPRAVQGFGIKNGDKSTLMQSLKQWHPTAKLGTQYLYSNVSFGLLGVVLEGESGMGYMPLLDKTVLQPLNMEHTCVDVPADQKNLQAQGFDPQGLPAKQFVSTYLIGGGSLRSSASDMLQFLKANLNISDTGTPDLLKAMQYAQQPHYTVKPNFIMTLGWQRITRNGNLFITKNGGNIGFSTFIGFSPDKKFGVVVLTNRAKAKSQQLGWQIMQALYAQ